MRAPPVVVVGCLHARGLARRLGGEGIAGNVPTVHVVAWSADRNSVETKRTASGEPAASAPLANQQQPSLAGRHRNRAGRPPAAGGLKTGRLRRDNPWPRITSRESAIHRVTAQMASGSWPRHRSAARFPGERRVELRCVAEIGARTDVGHRFHSMSLQQSEKCLQRMI